MQCCDALEIDRIYLVLLLKVVKATTQITFLAVKLNRMIFELTSCSHGKYLLFPVNSIFYHYTYGKHFFSHLTLPLRVQIFRNDQC